MRNCPRGRSSLPAARDCSLSWPRGNSLRPEWQLGRSNHGARCTADKRQRLLARTQRNFPTCVRIACRISPAAILHLLVRGCEVNRKQCLASADRLPKAASTVLLCHLRYLRRKKLRKNRKRAGLRAPTGTTDLSCLHRMQERHRSVVADNRTSHF